MTESVPVPRYELDQLLAVATMYVDSFQEDELMTLPEKLALQEVEAILAKYGRRPAIMNDIPPPCAPSASRMAAVVAMIPKRQGED